MNYKKRIKYNLFIKKLSLSVIKYEFFDFFLQERKKFLSVVKRKTFLFFNIFDFLDSSLIKSLEILAKSLRSWTLGL